jgi:predicted dithiol-disulfide oxidoreductase (DUF899 family)
MTSRAEQLAYQRRELQLRCALQRQQIAFLAQNIEGQLVTADRVFSVVSTVARSPLAILAVITGTMVLGPWRIFKWVSQGAVLFNLAKRVQHLIGK